MNTKQMPGEPFDTMQRRLREERRRTTAERDAFEEFTRRVQGLQTVTRPTTTTVLVERTADNGLEAILDIYRETVMAVPHYREEYDKCAHADIADEFGPGIAAMLPGSRGLDESTKRTVLLAADGSRRSRDALLEILDSESDSVESIASQLRTIAEELESISTVDFNSKTFGALDAYRGRIDTLRGKCDAIAATRQDTLGQYRHTTVGTSDVRSVPEYLYQEFDNVFPILAYIAELGDRMDTLHSRLSRVVSQYNADSRIREHADSCMQHRTES